MKRPENDKWLDKELSETIGSKETRTDFEQWKQQNPKAVEMLTSRTHRQAVSPGLLITRRIIMSDKNRLWKVAAVVALLCTGIATAAVVGAKIYKWHFTEKDSERGYLLTSEDGRTMTNIPEEWADSPERAVEVKGELDLLEQQEDRELVSVIEREVNGNLSSRSFIYKYVLSDGREIKSSDVIMKDAELKLTEAQEEEVMDLLKEMKYEELDSREEDVMGCTFVFKPSKFILSDGTEVIWTCGRPKDDQ